MALQIVVAIPALEKTFTEPLALPANIQAGFDFLIHIFGWNKVEGDVQLHDVDGVQTLTFTLPANPLLQNNVINVPVLMPDNIAKVLDAVETLFGNDVDVQVSVSDAPTA
jgi:hypothetical protein